MAGKLGLLRLKIIDDCLNNSRRKYTRDDLISAIEDKLNDVGITKVIDGVKIPYTISESAFNKDINLLRNAYNAPIAINPYPNDRYYYYTSNFNLNGINANSDEKRTFEVGLSFLSLLKNTNYAQSYQSVLEKLISSSNDFNTDREIVQIESPKGNLGMEWFDVIYDAIIEYNALKITHVKYDSNDKPKQFIVSPYMLKEYNNRWYMVAKKHDDKTDYIYCFGLDRIKSISASKEKFKFHNHEPFNASEFFEHSLGITRENKAEPIALVLKFSKLNIPYVLSEPWHQSQKIIEQTPESLTISLKVYPSHELNMKVLSYGAGVEVIKPAEYKKHILSVIEDMNKIYK
jgi:predicted DNA-binding transcriptional regulator YafY